MKNLILIIAILFTGTVDAQSFTTAKEIKEVTPEKLSLLGFEKTPSSDSISFKYWGFSEMADVWLNNSTGERIKKSPTAIEYIYNDSILIQKKRMQQNISYSLSSSIGDGWNTSPLTKVFTLNKDELTFSAGGEIYKRFGNFYLLRWADSEHLLPVSFVVFL